MGLVVCMGSACVTPTHASSAISGVILTHIQAGVTGDPTNEMVAIYNNTQTEVDITGWCIIGAHELLSACFAAPYSTYVLPPYSGAVVATQPFLDAWELDASRAALVYTPSTQRSGSLTGSGDTVTVVNAQGELQDTYSWDKSAPSGKIPQRYKSTVSDSQYETASDAAGWLVGALTEVPQNQVEVSQSENPNDPPAGEAEVSPTHPMITEVFADPTGADAGQEFIELYNPSEVPLSLDGYAIRIGKELEKSYYFPVGAVIEPAGYAAFTNTDIHYSLLNSASGVQLEYKGVLVGERVAYDTPPIGQSWALVQATWQYTTIPTPGDKNVVGSPIPVLTKDTSVIKALKPCAVNQYRHPVTNRCRLVASSSPKLQPCLPGQTRSSETNRCRSATRTTTPAACKEGQERNPDTNRCRTVKKMTTADYAVAGVATQPTTTSWYMWLGVVAVVGGVVAYAVWEWRVELKTALQWLRRKLVH